MTTVNFKKRFDEHLRANKQGNKRCNHADDISKQKHSLGTFQGNTDLLVVSVVNIFLEASEKITYLPQIKICQMSITGI